MSDEEDEAEFDQSKVPGYKSTLFHFKVLYEGWEMDNDAWVVELENGERALVATSHGSTYVARPAEFREKLSEYERAAVDTRHAMEMVGEHRPIGIIEGELVEAGELGEPARTRVCDRLEAELQEARNPLSPGAPSPNCPTS